MCGFFSSSTTMFPARVFFTLSEKFDHACTPEGYAYFNSLACLGYIVFSPKSMFCSPFTATNLFGDALRSSFTRENIPSKHDMSRSSSVHRDTDFHPSVLHFNASLSSHVDCSPHSTVTLDWLSSPFSSADHLLPSNKHHACSFIIVRCFFNMFSVIFINDLQIVVASLSTPHCIVSCFYHKSNMPCFLPCHFPLPAASCLATALLP